MRRQAFIDECVPMDDDEYERVRGELERLESKRDRREQRRTTRPRSGEQAEGFPVTAPKRLARPS